MASTSAGVGPLYRFGTFTSTSTSTVGSWNMAVSTNMFSSGGGFPFAAACQAVTVTEEGATCGCGKLSLPASAVSGAVTLDGVRQVIGSAFKLSHGETVGQIVIN